MSIKYRIAKEGNVQAIDPKTQKLLLGFSAIGIKYCRIMAKGIMILPTGKRKMALEVITTIQPHYLSLIRNKADHGFRCGEYEADKTGELTQI